MNIRPTLLTLCASLALVSTSAFAANTSTVTASIVSSPAQSVQPSAKSIHLASLDLTTACSGEASVKALTFVHIEQNDVKGVHVIVASGGKNLAKSVTFDPTNLTATVTFNQPLSIAACQKKTIDVLADFDGATPNTSHTFMIELQSDIQSDNADIAGSFPLKSNTVTISAQKPMSCMQSAMKGSTAKERSTMRRACRAEQGGK